YALSASTSASCHFFSPVVFTIHAAWVTCSDKRAIASFSSRKKRCTSKSKPPSRKRGYVEFLRLSFLSSTVRVMALCYQNTGKKGITNRSVRERIHRSFDPAPSDPLPLPWKGGCPPFPACGSSAPVPPRGTESPLPHPLGRPISVPATFGRFADSTHRAASNGTCPSEDKSDSHLRSVAAPRRGFPHGVQR